MKNGVLDFLLPKIMKQEISFFMNNLVNGLRKADPSWLGQGFEPGGNVDSFSIEVFSFNDDISHVDADPELHPFLFPN